MPSEPGRIAKLGALRPRRRRGETCLVIAPQPGHLQALLAVDHWRRGYDHVVAWVIDSFWTERIPFLARGRGHLDAICITDAELVDEWASVTATPTYWLPFGSDVLDRGSSSPDRPVDLVRVGRQPEPWDDDRVVGDDLAARGLRFSGRTPFHFSADANQRALASSMARAKFVLAFNNVVAPDVYTHGSRQYLTGRWTDALANGATVAGLRPRCAASDRLLWPGATLEFDSTERAHGVAVLGSALQTWSPDVPSTHHLQALRRLDWRRRIVEMCELTGIASTPTLRAEVDRLDARIIDLEG